MKLTLFDKRNETADVFSFLFKSENPITWKAGQFMFYTLPNDNPDERGITRYFTISSAPHEKHIMITTRFDKDKPSTFKNGLEQMKPGNTIESSGPDGDFIVDPDLTGVKGQGKEYIFIAGGIGITPYRSILLDMDFKKLPINATLLYSNRNEDIVFKEELESIAQRNPNFKIKYFISPARITEKDIRDLNSSFYISGPEPMVEVFGEMLKNMGIDGKNIKQDFFPGYQTDM